jgi:putative SOS response-associated peptidase YedK
MNRRRVNRLDQRIGLELERKSAELVSSLVDRLEVVFTPAEMERWLSTGPNMPHDLWEKAYNDSEVVALMNQYGVIFEQLQILER